MGNKLQRKIVRKEALEKIKDAKKNLASRVRGIFLPDQCSNCKIPFDKKSKEMAQTWFVVVRSEKKHLFCPECWDKIQKILPPTQKI